MNKHLLRSIVLYGLFAIPFIPFLVSSAFFFPFITTKAFAWRIVIEIVFAVWLLLALIDADYRPKKSYILYAIIGFLAVIGLSDLFGVAPLKSFWSNFERMEGFISLLHLGMFFVVISSVFREIDWKRWWNTSLAASFVMVLYGVLQIIGLKTINQGGARVDGTFGNAIYLAVYMLFHMFIATLLMWRERQDVTLRWVYGLLILAQGLILYFTATRGAILGLIGGLIIIALLNLRNRESVVMKKASIVILSMLIIVVGGFLLIKDSVFVSNSPVLSRFSSLTTESIKTQGRYFVWPMAIEGWKERPILGWGQENFSYVFQKHYRSEMFNLEPWFDRVHNIFLDWLVVGGIAGLVSYLSLYVILLYLIWHRNIAFSYTEKSIITGLIATYFFHNFFVFDHLISYILFFSLLAYVHRASDGRILWNKIVTPIQSKVAAVAIFALLIPGIYFINIKPVITNLSLIEALKAVQVSGDMNAAVKSFRRAYNSSSYLGRSETAEYIAANSTAILSSNLSIEDKNDFFNFAKEAIVGQADNKILKSDARYQLLVGSFLSSTGLIDEALIRLDKVRELMPNKQQIYFEIGAAYINNKRPLLAFEAFKTAYELAPENIEAKIIYLIGAIYAGDKATEMEMLNQIAERILVFDDRIINAYYANGRLDRVRTLLNDRIRLDPANKDTYQQYLNNLANQ